MKKRVKLQVLLLAAGLAIGISGCGQKSSSDQKIVSSSGGQGQGTPTLHGTVDGGGGAGFHGFPLEHYRRDLRTLPEYQKFVAPVLASVAKINPDFEKVFLHVVTGRLWLFMDAPIPELSREQQGIPFNFDQWAAQNSKSIWFSDQYKGDEKQRGLILLHEILVGLKIMRFLSYNEYCYAWTTDKKLCYGIGNDDVLIQNYKLDSLDHDDVRNMASWLNDNYQTMTAADFGHQMHIFQFQSPHFIWRTPKISLDDARVMNSTIDRMLGTKLSLFTNFDFNHEATAKCEVTFKKTDHTHFMAHVQVISLKDQKLLKSLNYTVAYDPAKQIYVNQVYSAYDRYLPVNLTDDRKLVAIGDRQTAISINYEIEVVTEFGGLEHHVGRMNNGFPVGTGDYSEPGAVLCEQSPIEKPLYFNAWLEMRDNVREFLEKRYYNGKTWQERMIEAYKRGEIQ